MIYSTDKFSAARGERRGPIPAVGAKSTSYPRRFNSSPRDGLVRGSAFMCHEIPSGVGWMRFSSEGISTLQVRLSLCLTARVVSRVC